MRKILFIAPIVIFLLSCKKESFRTEPTLFVGEWDWDYSVVYQAKYNSEGKLISNNIIDTIYPNTTKWNTNFSASIEVHKNGKVSLFKSGKKIVVLPDKILFVNSNFYRTDDDISNSENLQFFITTSDTNIPPMYAISTYPIDNSFRDENPSEFSILSRKNDDNGTINYFSRK